MRGRYAAKRAARRLRAQQKPEEIGFDPLDPVVRKIIDAAVDNMAKEIDANALRMYMEGAQWPQAALSQRSQKENASLAFDSTSTERSK